jgi:uncharacterized LabA/DUF88 family protein
MTLYVYVDNSNLWIEGQRVSAVRKGLATSAHDAMKRGIVDRSWTYDFGRLYQAICPTGEMIGRSSLFGSRPPANDSLWELARNEGFQVTTFDRNYANKEKQVDAAITTQIVSDSYEYMKPGDKLVLVSGDRDYLPPIDNLRSRGFPTLVAFWEHATGTELKQPPIDFFNLDPLFDYLTKKSATEPPAGTV